MEIVVYKLSALILLFITPGAALAQAFGVHMGDPVSKYSGKATENAQQYVIQVPQPHDEFSSYLAIATPQTGICKVTGLGKDHTSKYGTDVRRSFDQLSIAIDGKYGAGRKFDFIKSGALWKDGDEFIWSIYKDERSLSKYWHRDQGSNLPPELKIVGLHVKAVNANEAYISLAYEFTNMERCVSLKESINNRGL